MVQLHVLSGREAGKRHEGASFPITVGRGTKNRLAIADPGVFEEHFSIQFTSDGFMLSASKEAPTTVNGEATAGGILKNGDIIGAGLAKVQFWLGPLRQRGLKGREIFTWLMAGAMGVLQIYFLARLIEMARS